MTTKIQSNYVSFPASHSGRNVSHLKSVITAVALTALTALASFALLPFEIAFIVTGAAAFLAGREYCDCGCDDDAGYQMPTPIPPTNNRPVIIANTEFGPGPTRSIRRTLSWDTASSVNVFGSGNVEHTRPAPVPKNMTQNDIWGSGNAKPPKPPAKRNSGSWNNNSLSRSEIFGSGHTPSVNQSSAIATPSINEPFGNRRVEHPRPAPVNRANAPILTLSVPVEEQEQFGSAKVAHKRPKPVSQTPRSS